jgi:CelD/BcsL family acetyltransferase involved in cellulose biosynthesis
MARAGDYRTIPSDGSSDFEALAVARHVTKGTLVGPDELTVADQTLWRRALAARPIAFLSFEYVRAMASVVPNVRICCLNDEAGRNAFFPFQYRSKAHMILGIGRRLGGEMSDYFGIVAEPGFHIEPSLLLGLAGLRSISFSHLDDTQLTLGLVGDRMEIGHCIEVPRGGDAFWEQKRQEDKKFVLDTERRERKLTEKYGTLAFSFQSNEPAEALAKVIQEKRAQYRRTGVEDVLASEEPQAVLNTLSKCRDPQCTGVVSTLYAGSTWVASHFGLRSQDRLHYWFPVYNPELKSFAPGRLLLKQIIDHANELDLTTIDRGAGDSQAKRDLANSNHFFRSGLWQRKDVIAASHRIGLALHWRLDRFFRKRISGEGHGLADG